MTSQFRNAVLIGLGAALGATLLNFAGDHSREAVFAEDSAGQQTADGAADETPIGARWWPSKWGADDQRGSANLMTPKKVLEATRLIRNQLETVRVVILTAYAGPHMIAMARKAGASAYLFKNTAVPEILTTLRRVGDGEYLLGGSPDGPHPLSLSKREKAVLRQAARGETNDGIAWYLRISKETVKSYLTSSFRKLGVFDRTSAVVAALRQGYIEDENDDDQITRSCQRIPEAS